MATINATVTIGSDIMGTATNISKSMTMTKAGTSAGLENTSGLSAKTLGCCRGNNSRYICCG